MSEGAGLLLSGGPDSSTLAFQLASEHRPLLALTFNFGEEEGEGERRAATEIVRTLSNIEHRTIDFAGPLKALYKTADPVHVLRKMPDIDSWLAPFGSGIALALAASATAEAGFSELYYAVHQDDDYSDNVPEYFGYLSAAISLGTGQPFAIRTPFLDMRKYEVISLGDDLGVPFALTWSCAVGSEIHCGTCLACIDRREAFAESSFEGDPTMYAEKS